MTGVQTCALPILPNPKPSTKAVQLYITLQQRTGRTSLGNAFDSRWRYQLPTRTRYAQHAESARKGNPEAVSGNAISRRRAIRNVGVGLASALAAGSPAEIAASTGLVTRFTQLIGCTAPIQQAGMGSASPPALAAAVSEAGGLGMIGTARPGLNTTTLAMLIEQVRGLTGRPFGINFIARPGTAAARSPRAFIELSAKAARVVEFFYTDPDAEFVKMAHEHGALVSWQVGSPEEAHRAAEAGCDLIVVQGIEAGATFVARLVSSISCAKYSKACRRFRYSQREASVPDGRWPPSSRLVPTARASVRASSHRKKPAFIRSTFRL